MEYKKKRNSTETVLMIIIAVLLFLILVAAVLLFVRPIIRNKSESLLIDRQLSVGKRYLSDMDYDNAVAAFSDVIRIDDKNIDAHVGLGDAYTGMGNWEEAVDSYERAIVNVIEKVVVQEESVETYDRAEVMTLADLDDSGHEYMRDKEVEAIAVIVEGSDENQSTESVAVSELIGDHPSAAQVVQIIEKRNGAIEEVIKEREEKGEDISEFQEYIDWTDSVEQGENISNPQDEDTAAEESETDTTVEASQEETAARDVDYESFYAGPLADYRELKGYADSISDGRIIAEDKKLNLLFVERSDNETGYYKFIDINGDGFDELLIASSYGDSIIINDIYTNDEGSPEHALKNMREDDDYWYDWLGDRYRLSIDLENHELIEFGSYSAFSSYVSFSEYGADMIYPQPPEGRYVYDTTLNPVYSFKIRGVGSSEISPSEFEEAKARCDATLNDPEIFDVSGWNTF